MSLNTFFFRKISGKIIERYIKNRSIKLSMKTTLETNNFVWSEFFRIAISIFLGGSGILLIGKFVGDLTYMFLGIALVSLGLAVLLSK